MSISRRGFLSTLAATAAAAVYDPEMLLWKPGAKSFFVMQSAARRLQVFTVTAVVSDTLLTLDGPPLMTPTSMWVRHGAHQLSAGDTFTIDGVYA